MNRKALVLAALCVASAGPATLHAQAQQPTEPANAPAAPAAPASDAAAPPPAAAPAAPVGGKTIFIRSQMHYADNAAVDNAVRSECQLPSQGADLLETAGRNVGLNLVRNDEAVKAGQGRTFHVEIISVISAGNAFTGHRKQVTVRGRLMEGDKEIGVFQRARDSMGGAFAGFKGSCSVLGRCVEALSKDMATWLRGQSM